VCLAILPALLPELDVSSDFQSHARVGVTPLRQYGHVESAPEGWRARSVEEGTLGNGLPLCTSWRSLVAHAYPVPTLCTWVRNPLLGNLPVFVIEASVPKGAATRARVKGKWQHPRKARNSA